MIWKLSFRKRWKKCQMNTKLYGTDRKTPWQRHSMKMALGQNLLHHAYPDPTTVRSLTLPPMYRATMYIQTNLFQAVINYLKRKFAKLIGQEVVLHILCSFYPYSIYIASLSCTVLSTYLCTLLYVLHSTSCTMKFISYLLLWPFYGSTDRHLWCPLNSTFFF